ncbi:hypothetical protein NKH14_33295 [Mesorhizobium sp. M1380]|uniref:hypothetical protein n=1 Tax=Mesorhizobium sp. M1380 TaxID=2957093 RepID=UPI00333A75D2
MRNVALAALAALGLSACKTEQSANFLPSVVGSTSTVASQALDGKPYSIDPTRGTKITMPGIYTFHDDGSAYPICENDMKIAAIKALSTKVTVDSNDTLEDNLASTNWSISVPGVGTISAPYKKIKVEGYTVTHLVSGDSGNAADFILANLGDTCRNVTLDSNRPYMIVTDVATAKKAYSLSKGAFQALIATGPASLSWSNAEVKSTARSDVTFAVLGKYFGPAPKSETKKKRS